jgi:hypothetical protein
MSAPQNWWVVSAYLQNKNRKVPKKNKFSSHPIHKKGKKKMIYDTAV